MRWGLPVACMSYETVVVNQAGHEPTLLQDNSGLPPNTLGVLRTKRTKRSKKRGEMRNSLVGLENGYPSAYEVGTCYKVLFFIL